MQYCARRHSKVNVQNYFAKFLIFWIKTQIFKRSLFFCVKCYLTFFKSFNYKLKIMLNKILKKRSLGEYRTALLRLSVIHRSMDMSRVWVCIIILIYMLMVFFLQMLLVKWITIIILLKKSFIHFPPPLPSTEYKWFLENSK